MKQTRDGLCRILNLEEEKYSEMLRKGGNVILTQMKKIYKLSEEIPDDILFTLNDSHGIPPDMVINLAMK